MDLEQLKAGNRNPLLPLTCLLFGDNKCLVHEDPNRPPCCRESQCQLLKRFLRNEIKLEQGKRIIEEIRKLINKILHQLPQSDGLKPAIYIITNVLNSLQLELSSGNRSNIELFMDMVTLKRLVYHHILPIEGV